MATRLRTLAAAIVPVGTGTVLAARIDDWHAVPAFFCFAFALLVQIGTNFANDYFDFVKGADTDERVGPTRVVASGLVSLGTMRRAVAGVFALAFLTGLNLVFYGGWWLVPVGVSSILCGLAYTAGPFPLAYNGLGDLFVFAFFGLIAVGFTFYVQTGFFAGEIWLAGAAIGALATNILAVNNLRDRETDARVGKNTLAVRFGRRWILAQYAGSLFVSGAIPVVFYVSGYGVAVLLPLALAPMAYRLHSRLRTVEDGSAAFNSILARTGAFLLGYGLLFSAGLLLS